MKRFLLPVLLLCLAGCTSSRKTGGNTDPAQLDGVWILEYISGPRIAFEGLYPNKKPQLVITAEDKRISGNTGCNAFSGPLVTEGGKISFDQPMALTKMACPGEGEMVFLETLKKVNAYSISHGNTLNLNMDEIPLMRFVKK